MNRLKPLDLFGGKCLSSIIRMGKRRAGNPNPKIVVRVHQNLSKIGWSRVDVASLFPSFSTICTSVHTTAVDMFHSGINDSRIPSIYRNTDSSRVSSVLVRQTLGQFFPSHTAVRCLVECTAGATTI